MSYLIGLFVVIGCVLGGFVLHHGKIGVLWQPTEFLIILGAAVGAFIISNPGNVIKQALKMIKFVFKSKPYSKANYMELLTFLFVIFKLMKTKGLLALESHIENPHESEIFKKYPSIVHDHHLTDFICDYLRLLVMGVDNYMYMEDLLDRELEVHHHAHSEAAGALGTFGEGLPALGIVAAVLGVINTMGSITEPPAVLGELIGGALVGTFCGILLSYGIFSPMAAYIGKYADEESKYWLCIKTGIITYMQGNAPAIVIEFIRKQIPVHLRPSFREVETALNNIT
jgi:chemotaxis protein MotA